MKQPVDSLIFDMDGTLWDAVESYCRVWDTTAASLGVSRQPVEYDKLVALMGKPLGEIYLDLIGDVDLKDRFMERLTEVENELMPRLGGKLYQNVDTTLQRLKDRGIRLFMISNCTGRGLDNFLNLTGLRQYFTDWLSYGATGVDKDVNIRRLIERYDLKRPVYVGDIQRDCDSSHAAGIECAWAAYGFGRIVDADFRIDSFDELESKVIDDGKED